MTIAEVREKCKGLAARIPKDYLILAIIVLSSSLSFFLGYLSGADAGRGSGLTASVSPAAEIGAEGEIVASKNGTKYYYPNCGGASRISDANKVWFTTPAAAEEAGYSAAANCTRE